MEAWSSEKVRHSEEGKVIIGGKRGVHLVCALAQKVFGGPHLSFLPPHHSIVYSYSHIHIPPIIITYTYTFPFLSTLSFLYHHPTLLVNVLLLLLVKMGNCWFSRESSVYRVSSNAKSGTYVWYIWLVNSFFCFSRSFLCSFRFLATILPPSPFLFPYSQFLFSFLFSPLASVD